MARAHEVLPKTVKETWLAFLGFFPLFFIYQARESLYVPVRCFQTSFFGVGELLFGNMSLGKKGLKLHQPQRIKRGKWACFC